jgi:hypothetical protein
MEVQDLKQRCTELDQLLNSLSGVIAARTVTENDEITDIHILSDSTKSPKQLLGMFNQQLWQDLANL